MIVQTEKITIMEKYFIHSNELHLIDVDKIHQAVERIVDSLDMPDQLVILIFIKWWKPILKIWIKEGK
jgi:hypothetical protein